MDYDSLPIRIRERVPRNTYESAPEDLRQMIVMMVEDRIRREDRAAVIQLDDGYQHHEIPPHMNIVQHRYILRPDAPEPDRQQFVRILGNHIHALSQISRYRMRNITVRYDTSDGLAQWFSFSRTNIESMGFDRLVEHLAENEGEWDEDYYGGSDFIRSYLTLRTLNVREFYIITELVQSGVGEVEYSYYKCIENTEDAENNCLINCFRYLSKKNFEPEKVRYLLGVEPNAMLTFEHIPKLESIFKIKVGVYEDRRTLAFAYKSGKHYYDYKAIIKRDYPIVLYGDLNSPYKILWKNNHSAVIVEEYMARDCHCEYTGIFVGHGNSNKLRKEEIIKELQRQGRIDTDESTIADDDKTTYYYFFDYETVYDPITAELSPYAWALVKYDSEGNHIQTWNDVASKPGGYAKSILEILLLEIPALDERKYLIGFNNSRFDNYFLIRDCQLVNAYVSNAFFAGNSILGMNIKGFIVRDLCRILCTSLKEACESFKCDIGKGNLKHEEIQDNFWEGKPFDQALVREYVIRDCTSLAELFFKSRKEFKNLISMDIEKYNTIGSMSYNAFKQVCTLEHFEYPIIDKNTNEIIRQSIYGGRSQIFTPCEIKDRKVESIDCVSLYPYVMLHYPYPIGECIFTENYIKEKIGIYQCIIHKQPSRNIIPFRSKKEPLDWTYEQGFVCTLNSVDIEMIRKYDGEVEILVGYYWEETREDIFEYYFRSIIKEKYKQDEYKESKDNKQYNIALRECCKLLMNVISGKLQQRVFENTIELIRNNQDLDKFNKKVNNNTEIFTPLGSWYIAEGEKINPKPNMPTIWGSLILSHARSYMYDNILSKIDNIYGMDTDSAFINYDDVPTLERVELIGTKLGQFKREMSIKVYEGESGPYGIFVAPKCYCFYKISASGEEIPIKMRFKGVNITRDKVVYDIEKITKMRIKELHDTYWNSTKTVTIDTFRTLLQDNVYILCTSLERRLAGATVANLNIRNQFVLKKINKANPHGELIPLK